MAGTARPESSTSRILSVFALIVLGVIAWFVAPMFLPMWRWRNMDFPALAVQTKLSEKLLRQEYQVTFRFAPRGGSKLDPAPWQILTMSPTWNSLYEEDLDEEKMLVRCVVVSDRDGEPISALYVGGTFKDRYFTATCWRFPGGTFGMKPATRPVLIYRSLSLEKVSIGQSDMYDSEIRRSSEWANDDEDPERFDEFDPQVAAEEARLKAEEAAAAQQPAQPAP